ncbi:MAG TPA: TIGR01459 family HAD-type hydrolase [Alphaproteobacteria bacterium]|nr:TIGR01459 family HAD-type hydrolase [Alphaproteobacteria bacterium]
MASDPESTPDTPAISESADALPIVDGLASLAGEYDGFIVDLWGTVHNGVEPLPGAVDCLERLKALGKPVLILSNAPRRAGEVAERMRAMGISDACYDAVCSSGEAAHMALRDRSDRFHAGLGRACFLLGPPEDDSVIAGLDFERVDSIKTAHFILAIGAYRSRDTARDYDGLLEGATQRRLAMVCANPDLEVLRGGAREICAGAIAARFEIFGGEVRYHGKPHPPIYAASLALMGLRKDARILSIGDALPTDIKGANAAGLDALLITGGIHAETLGIEAGETPDPAALDRLMAEHGARPRAAAAAFRW